MVTSTLRLSSLLACLVVAGCVAATGGTPTGPGGSTDMAMMPNGSICSAGAVKACICLGGGMGTQVCRSTGTSYGSCTGCANAPDGGLAIGDAGTGGNQCGTCNGCCQGTQCIPFANETSTECGVAGTTCTSCGANTCDTSNGTCISQTMASAPCGDSCTGCCGMLNGQQHCYVDTANQCGSDNEACTTCMSGTTCDDGECDPAIDPTHNFTVTVYTAQVYNTDGMGNQWDETGFDAYDLPDVEVCFTISKGTGCTTVINNVPVDNGMPQTSNTATDTAMWSGTDGVLTSGGSTFYIPGSEFINGTIQISVLDQDDTSSNDTIGSENAGTFATTAMSGFDTGAFNRVVDVYFQIQ